MTKIMSDNKRLIYSNRICCISKKSIDIKVDITENAMINIIFNFFYEKSKKVNTTMRSPENGKVIFDLTNYVNSLGTGITEPVEVGELNNKRIFIMFYVYRLGEDTYPILDLSLYLEV